MKKETTIMQRRDSLAVILTVLLGLVSSCCLRNAQAQIGQTSTANISVSAVSSVRTVDGRTLGINTAIWDPYFGQTWTRNVLNAMGTKTLRFPGGSSSDGYHWKTNSGAGNAGQWANSFDTFASTARAVGAQVFITTNYGSGTAQEAADWVRYSNVTKGYGFKYWEVGNENYGTWEYDEHPAKNDPYTYAVQFKAYMNAMKAVDPTIKVGIVISTGEDAWVNNTSHPATNPRTKVAHNGWTPVMLATLKSLNCTPDFAAYHRYEQSPWQENDAYLLQSTQGWIGDANDLRQQLTDYLGTNGAKVELVCTETNSVSYSPGKQTASLVGGMYVADTFGNLLQTEFNSCVFWNLRNAPESYNNNSSSLYGWRWWGDYGVVTDMNGYYPTYYVFKLLAQFVHEGDQVVVASADTNLLGVYATRGQNGGLSLLVINKNPSATTTADIKLFGFTPSGNATISSYGIPQDEANRQIMVNNAKLPASSMDISTTTFTPRGSRFSYSFAPYSVNVITFAGSLDTSDVAPSTGLYINCGGGNYAASDGTVFVSDRYVSNGLSWYWNVNSGVANAPLYTSVRYDATGFNYNLPATAGNYTLKLHFAEGFGSVITKAGQRLFNVAVNGTKVLSNFDVVGTAGGQGIPVVKSFPVTSDGSGVKVQFNAVLFNPMVSAIELIPTSLSGGGGSGNGSGSDNNSGGSQVSVGAPSGLTATAGNAQIALTWTSSSKAVTYSIKRGTKLGGPYTTIATNVSATNYTDKTVTNGTTYYYVVSGVNGDIEGPNSNEVSATPKAPDTRPTLRINCGSAAWTSPTGEVYQADQYASGGSIWGWPVNQNQTNKALLQAVRYENAFGYTLPAKPGNYTLKLHFAEGTDSIITKAGQRLFNITVNGTKVLTNFDVVKTAGGVGIETIQTIAVTATGNTITLGFQGVKYYAYISAIELIPTN